MNAPALGEAVGADETAARGWIYGERVPQHPETWLRLAAALHASVESLLVEAAKQRHQSVIPITSGGNAAVAAPAPAEPDARRAAEAVALEEQMEREAQESPRRRKRPRRKGA